MLIPGIRGGKPHEFEAEQERVAVGVPPAVEPERPARRMRRQPFPARWLAICFGLWLMAGCASSSSKTSAPAIQSLHLFSVPVAVNLDTEPGPDGFAVRLFAKGSKSSKGIVIPKGTLEILMFDGVQTAATNTPPLRTWKFSGEQLKKHAGQSAVGSGYRFTLRWEEARPTKSRFSIVARYTPPSGTAISSAPSTITVGAK